MDTVNAEGTLLTALTRDGGARLLFAHTTDIVEYARLRHGCRGQRPHARKAEQNEQSAQRHAADRADNDFLGFIE